MNDGSKRFGLEAGQKDQLLQRLRGRDREGAAREAAKATAVRGASDDMAGLEFYRQMQIIRSASETLGISNPFFRAHDGMASAETEIGGRRYINYSSYNYLGLNGDPRVSGAAKAAIDRYGTSVSASRLVAGERPLHQELEARLAAVHGTEDCVIFVSGHATNVTVIGHLLGRNDLILHDALIHNSVLQGAQLAGARRLGFPHNDAAAAEKLLAEQRGRFGRVLIVIEGHYSMDGDVPDVPAFSALARRFDAWLMVDEAHSLGVLGERGRGVAEHFGLDGAAVDFWMGTLSKTLAGAGGYIAAKRDLVEYLKFSAPGFVYSVGMSPPLAAAAIAALAIMEAEPERVARLNENAQLFLRLAKAAGLDTGRSEGRAIVPIITGSSIAAGRLSEAMFRRGVNVQPILYPAVPDRSARLRFFLSSDHTASQIEETVAILLEETARLAGDSIDIAAVAMKVGGEL